MIEPSSKRSTVLQLNMGEGKSSVIVPMVATALADGDKLLRVVVLKSLSSQMFQLLVERLSGLANRRIFFMPFSRNVQVNHEQVDLFRKMHEQCIKERGVLLAMVCTGLMYHAKSSVLLTSTLARAYIVVPLSWPRQSDFCVL